MNHEHNSPPFRRMWATREMGYSWECLCTAIERSDKKAVQQELQKYSWMSQYEQAHELLMRTDKTTQQEQTLGGGAGEAIVRMLVQRIRNGTTWKYTVNTLMEKAPETLERLWPVLKTAPIQHLSRPTIEKLAVKSLQTFSAKRPSWFAELLQLYSNGDPFEAELFWAATEHPDPDAITDIMEHPLRPDSTTLLEYLEFNFCTPYDLQRVRPYCDLKQALNTTMLKVYLFWKADKPNIIDSNLNIWWKALTPQEKKEWLHEQPIQHPEWNAIPMVALWQEHQALQAMAHTTEPVMTVKKRL